MYIFFLLQPVLGERLSQQNVNHFQAMVIFVVYILQVGLSQPTDPRRKGLTTWLLSYEL